MENIELMFRIIWRASCFFEFCSTTTQQSHYSFLGMCGSLVLTLSFGPLAKYCGIFPFTSRRTIAKRHFPKFPKKVWASLPLPKLSVWVLINPSRLVLPPPPEPALPQRNLILGFPGAPVPWVAYAFWSSLQHVPHLPDHIKCIPFFIKVLKEHWMINTSYYFPRGWKLSPSHCWNVCKIAAIIHHLPPHPKC